MSALDFATSSYLSYLLDQIKENHNKDAAYVSYTGPIDTLFLDYYKNQIEQLATSHKNGLARDDYELNIILNTPGGVVEAVEKMVEINRYHFKTVNFIVPDMAMSAGTIFCMSGDNIYMDYSSSLGPIDPQVKNDNGMWVPALGYLDKYEELVCKSIDNVISGVEFARFQNIDLAELSRYEQAKELSISLLNEWLVEYKFKDWNVHSTTGKKVSKRQKVARAKKIGEMLMDNKLWGSHGRMISMKTLIEKVKLKIDDYSNNIPLRNSLNQYSELITEKMQQRNLPVFMHHREGN